MCNYEDCVHVDADIMNAGNGSMKQFICQAGTSPWVKLEAVEQIREQKAARGRQVP